MIPKIIHQIWIGNVCPPTKHMDTWKDKNPDFEYIRWNEEELIKREMKIECQNRVDEMNELNGKADIIRWEILYKYGGIFLDADSICVEPIDDVLMKCKSFAGWEHEKIRSGLIATGTMGFPPKHPLVREIILWIKTNCVDTKKTNKRAWQLVGPLLLTNIYNIGKYNDLTIFPSYYFLPIHYTGIEYKGHGKIYAYQEWGSSHKNYQNMNNMLLPEQFKRPSKENSISILISSLNTNAKYLKECLDSIKHQEGCFNMEIVWINDGSDTINTTILKNMLERFKNTTRFTEIKYIENNCNKGLGYSLNYGVTLCSNELIFRMDADDIMYHDRIIKQLKFMNENSDIILCGTQVNMFKEINNEIQSMGITKHPSIDIESYKKNHNHWVMNHPTFCFRKKEIIEIGNYNSEIHSMCEDFELILRVLKRYSKIHNMEEALLYYRLHNDQLTYNGGKEGSNYWTNKRNLMIKNIITCEENINNNVTVVLTSCNRPNELSITLKSFFKFNTYPIKKIIIIDDSGINKCIDNCIKYIPDNIDKKIIYNEHNIGQIKSIDKAYFFIDTEYIFHCEDDWEFYDYGFIEKSLNILESNDKVFTVWLRKYNNFRVNMNGHPINKEIINNEYRILGVFKERTNIWCGFTFNPGLRRFKDYQKFMPYCNFINSKYCNCGGVEQALSNIYYSNNYVSVITLNKNGFVKHIGWDNPTKK